MSSVGAHCTDGSSGIRWGSFPPLEPVLPTSALASILRNVGGSTDSGRPADWVFAFDEFGPLAIHRERTRKEAARPRSERQRRWGRPAPKVLAQVAREHHLIWFWEPGLSSARLTGSFRRHGRTNVGPGLQIPQIQLKSHPRNHASGTSCHLKRANVPGQGTCACPYESHVCSV